ncbi:A/G-specific adenine glycosylase [Schleiferia thermophila]|jgi:A/G-specific adenine glycosylase|uniref:Adenine DNA glycosylase n=1 Tax=Schleiferia thermophila TaxID=884107 RepID=A0A369A2P3_9FLAO|nr:A/G-specific adenine glycosylase [Schleiferia thermophila]KFD38490.1 adenine glycosylase [Schleiferia thermophila str. Yellowstone]RCX03590.1 A/G-specific DNA-adenine glycosylase [Schleiferia thermophila]GCD79826.1 A/G-specific adenine glycosylase [Schleiferia thermophila]
MANPEVLSFFVSRVSSWFKLNGRPLPWRLNPTPYHIWLAEIIFQQTRIGQGMDYYTSFIARYPDIESLSKAEEDEVLRLWQGLGYYTRAINLLKTARIIASEGGMFPSDVETLKKLPGIGPYTAGAISSIAFGRKEPLVDGNVQRVFSRFFGLKIPVNDPKSQKILYRMAGEIIRMAEDASAHNQGLMDLGSTICKPLKPLCERCPLHEACIACVEGNVDLYPVKIKKNKKMDRFIIFGYCTDEGRIAIQKRDRSDIWKNLYQLPLLADSFNSTTIEQYAFKKSLLFSIYNTTHQLSHQKLHIGIYPVEEDFLISNKVNYTFIDFSMVQEIAFPVPLMKFLSSIPKSKSF